jgi:hypothetical protein
LQAAFWTLRTSFLNDLIFEPEQFLRNRYQLYILIGLLIKALNAKDLATPHFSSIPILSLQNASDLPVPFDSSEEPGNNQWEKWLQLSSSRLASKSYLGEGEWCGYVSNDLYLLTFNGLLEDIRLQVNENDTTCAIRSDGREGHMSFTLEGRVVKADGRAIITQEYPGLQTCLWHGFITSFGIVGYWNMVYAPRPLGLFWIWKK